MTSNLNNVATLFTEIYPKKRDSGGLKHTLAKFKTAHRTYVPVLN